MINLTEEEERQIKWFFKEIVEKEGLLEEWSSKELWDLNKRAREGDYTSQLLMIELFNRIIPQLDQDILKEIRKDDF